MEVEFSPPECLGLLANLVSEVNTGVRFLVPRFRFRVSGFRIRVTGLRIRASDFRFRVTGFRDSEFGIRDSGFEERGEDFVLRVDGSKRGIGLRAFVLGFQAGSRGEE